MAVKPEYKQISAAAVPPNWRSLDLSELCTLQRGFDITEANRSPGTIPVYSSSGLSYYHNKPMVSPPGVVTGRKGILGKVFLVNEPFWPHDTTLWVTDFKGNHPAYVALVLQSFHLERLDAATSVPTLNRNNLAGHQVMVPITAAEQRAIAEALSEGDALIDSLEQLIAKKRHIKEGVMQELLTGKRRLPGFSGDWEVKRLGGRCELITKGTTPTSIGRGFTESGVKFLKAESISETGTPIPEKLAFIDSTTHKLLGRSQLKEGDLLISIAGVLGRVGRVSHEILPANTNQALAIIRLGKSAEIERSFLFYYLRSPKTMKQIADVNVQAAQANISLQNVQDLAIHVPPSFQEQTAIAEVLSDMDAELTALERRLGKTRAVKQAMMQELLTGRIRLV